MKTILLLTLSLFLFFTNTYAKTWVINNMDANADFNEIVDAHNSSQVLDGDILYVEGSTERYTSFDCTKQLTIIGAGYYLAENRKTANMLSSMIVEIDFRAGSEGSTVIGMTFNGSSSAAPNFYANNITVKRCYTQGPIVIGNVNGARILSSDIYKISKGGTSVFFNEVVVCNNIIRSNLDISTCEFQKIENNILLGSDFSLNVAYFRNNIVLDGSAAISINSNYITHNIASNQLFDSNNYNVSDLNALFVNGDSPDMKYVLSESSFAKGKGHDGSDCGIFGGSTPYVVSGLPTIPVITELETDQAGNLNSGLSIRVKVSTY
ncbi:hypothetical protein [Carboxylicivirga linearis]|uniref:Right handed beta helix domain-containing protein n=1 Tax=Carboxylicivirga linearis TaxID=1628157 RepID=A0ABS5JYT3_9BACT|nr:hypothetical protein [Carboxylicivirga linearis]MBS2100018.1 hypothetical protein [Carboxylicivirga linearis]